MIQVSNMGIYIYINVSIYIYSGYITNNGFGWWFQCWIYHRPNLGRSHCWWSEEFHGLGRVETCWSSHHSISHFQCACLQLGPRATVVGRTWWADHAGSFKDSEAMVVVWQNMILVKPHSLLWVKQNCQTCTHQAAYLEAQHRNIKKMVGLLTIYFGGWWTSHGYKIL